MTDPDPDSDDRREKLRELAERAEELDEKVAAVQAELDKEQTERRIFEPVTDRDDPVVIGDE